MPWTPTESVADKESADGDRDCECDEGADCTDTEYRPDGDVAREYQQNTRAAHKDIEPYRINRCFGMRINPCPEPTERETAVSGVCECYPTCRHHATLTHAECGDDSEREGSEGCFLSKTLQEQGRPRLAQITIEDFVDVDYNVSGDELQEPAEDTANAGGQDNGAWGRDVGV